MAEGQESKKRKRDVKLKKVYIYGNYRNYYGYRIDRNVKEDPRLAVMKRDWFEGKDCLDIGCNQGMITISIAKKFLCRSILGIDIDAGLIENACWNLRKVVRMEQNSKAMKASKLEVSNNPDCLEHQVPQVSKEDMPDSFGDASHPRDDDNILERVRFRKENFVESLHGCSEIFDTILCLSVAKWIHLNWGDDGLITLFVKAWRLLRPGGILLLEPQPWSSYKKNRLVSETAQKNFNEILIRPDKFQEILLDKVGFRSAETVTDSLSGTVAGFNRPILALIK